MQRSREWREASDSEWSIARDREAVIQPLAALDRVSQAAIEDASERLGLARSSVYRLINRYRKRPRTSSLLPLQRGRAPDSWTLDAKREALLNATMGDFYLKPQKPTIQALFREVRLRFTEAGLAPPNYRTVRRRISTLDPKQVTAAREGTKAARDRFGPVAGSFRTNGPLDVVQIDHTLVDVIVVDREERLPIGRPWLSVAIDVATRTVAGFSVSLDPPSSLSVSLVLSHAVLLKAAWLADRDLDSLDWPVAGIPKAIHLDNAQEFHAEALVRGCQEYGIQIDHRPIGKAHYGGHIERLIGTVMGAVRLLPGATFSNVEQRREYDSEANAVMTLPELERWLALQIAGVYHLIPHSGLRRSPLSLWQESVQHLKHPLRLPTDPEEFYLDFLPAERRLIRKDGIHLHSIRYWSSVLSPWAGRLERPLLVAFDPRNLSRVFVRDPDGRHWAVPYADLGQPPIALWELDAARKRLREAGINAQTERQIFENILLQRQLVAAAFSQSKQRRKKERTPPVPPKASKPTPKPAESKAEELKPYPVEIWDPKIK
jgi:putative transposase